MDVRYENVVYQYRGYCYEVVQPGKDIVTVSAYLHLKRFLEELEEYKTVGDYRLTKRENQVMELLIKGYKLKDVAESLEIEVTTVKTFLSSIYSRYGVNDKLNAVLTYLKNTKGG